MIDRFWPAEISASWTRTSARWPASIRSSLTKSLRASHWPDEDPIGKRIRLGGDDPGNPLLTILGVVGRVKMESLSQDSHRVQGYFCFAQMPFGGMTVITKATGDPNQLVAALREQVKAIDPDQPIYNIRTMNEIRADSVAQ